MAFSVIRVLVGDRSFYDLQIGFYKPTLIFAKRWRQ